MLSHYYGKTLAKKSRKRKSFVADFDPKLEIVDPLKTHRDNSPLLQKGKLPEARAKDIEVRVLEEASLSKKKSELLEELANFIEKACVRMRVARFPVPSLKLTSGKTLKETIKFLRKFTMASLRLREKVAESDFSNQGFDGILAKQKSKTDSMLFLNGVEIEIQEKSSSLNSEYKNKQQLEQIQLLFHSLVSSEKNSETKGLSNRKEDQNHVSVLEKTLEKLKEIEMDLHEHQFQNTKLQKEISYLEEAMFSMIIKEKEISNLAKESNKAFSQSSSKFSIQISNAKKLSLNKQKSKVFDVEGRILTCRTILKEQQMANSNLNSSRLREISDLSSHLNSSRESSMRKFGEINSLKEKLALIVKDSSRVSTSRSQMLTHTSRL